MIRIALTFALVVLLCPGLAGAGDIRKVVSAGPQWDTFTNEDGSGLYHEILRAVFALYGVTVRHEYVPTDRGDEMVRQGQADMMTCDDHADAPLVQGRYPMFVNDYHVFFKRSRIKEWKGPESLRDKEVVAQLGYYHDWDFPVPVHLREVANGPMALRLILMNRSDFYVDDMAFIRQSMKGVDMSFAMQDYDVQRIGTRSYHPLFNLSERGMAVRKMYEEGVLYLHQAGALKPIYDKWGYQYPRFCEY